MKKTVSLWVLLMGLTTSTPVLSQTPTSPTNDPRRLEDLVKQLGSTKYVERERAQKELEALGDAALEPLRKAAKEGDLEVSRRAAEMVRRLEDRIANVSLLAPKKINLKLQDVTVLDAVAELAKQSGYALQVDGDRSVLAHRKVSLETGEVTFWEALDKLCARSGLVEKTVIVNTLNPYNPNPLPLPVRPIPPLKIKPKALPAPAPGGILPNVQPANPPKAEVLKVAPVQIQPVEVQVEVQIQAVPLQAVPVQPGQIQAVPVQVQPAQPQPAPAQPAQAKPILAQAQVQIQIQPGGVVPVRPQPQGNPLQITLVNGKSGGVPTCYSGAVRLRIVPADANLKKQAGETLLVLEATPEPRLQGFQVLGNPSITKAVDDQDQNLTLALESPQGINNPNQIIQNRLIALPRNPQAQNRPIPVRLKLGEKQAKNLKELSGTLTAQVQLPPEPLLVLDNVLKAQGQTAKGKSGGSLTLQNIEKTANNEYKLQITVENPPGQPNPFGGFGGIQVIGNVQIQMAGGSSVGNQGIPELVDAKGKPYQAQVSGRGLQINNGMVRQNLTVVYRANNNQEEPSRLILTGTRTTNVAIPFSFKDLPLP